MFDWNVYCKELKGCIGEIGKFLLDMVKGYVILVNVGVQINYLDVKICELIVLVVVVIICCDGCIIVYVDVVLKYGVSCEEIVEVLGVVVLFNVGVVLVYLVWVMDVVVVYENV